MYVGKQMLDNLETLAHIHRRQEALRSLIRRRHKRLRETLDHRILRGKEEGIEPGPTREDWLRFHNGELTHLRGQLANLQLEMLQARAQRASLRRAMVRAKRVRAHERRKAQ
jgi:hypothetical protein